MDKLIDFKKMREQCEAMREQKAAVFPTWSVVSVESDRFHGVGIVTLDETCPLEKLAVRVESRNVWWYPIEDCQPHGGKLPIWIRSCLRSYKQRRARPVATASALSQTAGNRKATER